MSNDTMPANPILTLKPEPNTVVFCADGEPYLTIGPDDVPPDVIERFQSWVKNNTPPVTPTVPKHLVDALIEKIKALPVEHWVQEGPHGEPVLVGYVMQAQDEWVAVNEAVAAIQEI
jgi:hypothetical protein